MARQTADLEDEFETEYESELETEYESEWEDEWEEEGESEYEDESEDESEEFFPGLGGVVNAIGGLLGEEEGEWEDEGEEEAEDEAFLGLLGPIARVAGGLLGGGDGEYEAAPWVRTTPDRDALPGPAGDGRRSLRHPSGRDRTPSARPYPHRRRRPGGPPAARIRADHHPGPDPAEGRPARPRGPRGQRRARTPRHRARRAADQHHRPPLAVIRHPPTHRRPNRLEGPP